MEAGRGQFAIIASKVFGLEFDVHPLAEELRQVATKGRQRRITQRADIAAIQNQHGVCGFFERLRGKQKAKGAEGRIFVNRVPCQHEGIRLEREELKVANAWWRDIIPANVGLVVADAFFAITARVTPNGILIVPGSANSKWPQPAIEGVKGTYKAWFWKSPDKPKLTPILAGPRVLAVTICIYTILQRGKIYMVIDVAQPHSNGIVDAIGVMGAA